MSSPGDRPALKRSDSEGVAVLDVRNHQGKFGADYIRVLASAAGLIWSEDDVDLDGVDLCINFLGAHRTDSRRGSMCR